MNRLCVMLGAAGLVISASAAGYAQQALGTAFTYQGVLDQSGSPTNGLHDMRFQMFTLGSGGTQVQLAR